MTTTDPTVAAGPTPSPAGRFSTRRVRAMVRRSFLSQSRNPGYWFLLLVLPLVDGLLFGSIGVAFDGGDEPVELMVTGILLFHLIWQLTLAGSFGLLDEVWSRNLMNLIATPLTEREMLASFGIVGLVRTLVATLLIGGVGLAFFAVSPTSAGIVLVPSAVLLLAFGWAVALFVVGMTLQYGDKAEVFSWGTLVLLMPLSGVFYPVEDLPGALQAVAEVVPLTHVFDAVRTGVEERTVVWGELGVAAAWAAVIAAASTWFVAHQLRRFRRNGWITRFL
jgi:ABC-2 type transport system permease protein